MVVTIVGVGLMGGSMAISLKESGFAERIIGVDRNQAHLDKAIRRRLIDEDMPLLPALAQSDLVVLAVPVDALLGLLPLVMDNIDRQVVTDMGSTKTAVVASVAGHPKRGRYVAGHPMAGTEHSGPEAAIPELYKDKCAVICDESQSDVDALETVRRMYKAAGMRLVGMDAVAHDVHTAYISHISHITSFALAITVLEKERNEQNIFQLASGGFSSTVRLAKSSPDMWVPIFRQNRDNVLDVLDEHINTLSQFRSLLIKKDFDAFYQMIEQANDIKRILK
jgi:prephenate dehydrogenase